jgi:NAD(P)-dependent dehydrogenase (short-subunit alcohol dehydrogenase family)
MTKAGVVYFTKYFAKYYENEKIRFNCVSPGGIERDQGPIFKSRYSDNTMVGRMAQSSEIAKVIKFLCSPDSSYINGENIFVDGGITKW